MGKVFRHHLFGSSVILLLLATFLSSAHWSASQNSLIIQRQEADQAYAEALFAEAQTPYSAANDFAVPGLPDGLQQFLRSGQRATGLIDVVVYNPSGQEIMALSGQRDVPAGGSELLHVALQGQPATGLYSRADFTSGFVTRSYVPLFRDGGSELGVVEVISDASKSVAAIETAQTRFNVSLGGIFILLLGIQYYVVRQTRKKSIAYANRGITFQQEQKFRSLHDSLTGLPSRVLLRDRLEHAMKLCARNETLLAVLYIDLDRFKAINNAYGNSTGDYVLRQFAERLLGAVRNCDTVARFGDDEFVVVLENLYSTAQGEVIAERILKNLSAPVVVDGQKIHVSSSMGLAYYPFDDVDIDGIIKNADAAMYMVKKAGNNAFRAYSHDMRENGSTRLILENNLRNAQANNEYQLYLQPIVNVENGSVYGFEALMRWNSKALGMVSPVEFIPVLEETGLIHDAGTWVLETACSQMEILQRRFSSPLRLHINISPRQFQNPRFVHEVMTIIKHYDVDASLIELEITENILIDNVQFVLDQLGLLSEQGIKVSIDDFGTGYSSFSYLKHMPVNTVKIDRSFVADLSSCSDSTAIVAAISAMSNSLGLKAIAEGVETPDQLDVLRKMNVSLVQGYMFCKPITFEQVLAKLEQDVGKVVLQSC